MGASFARKRTRLGCRVLRHELVPFLALWPVFHARRWSFDTQSVLVHFLPNMCLCVASEVTLLEIPPCQTPMCGVAYSCSYVLLLGSIHVRVNGVSGLTYDTCGHPKTDLFENGSFWKRKHVYVSTYPNFCKLPFPPPPPRLSIQIFVNGPYSPKGKKWRPRAPGGIMPR